MNDIDGYNTRLVVLLDQTVPSEVILLQFVVTTSKATSAVL